MARVCNRYRDFPYGYVERRYTWIESGLGNDGAFAPQEETGAACYEDYYGHYNGQVFWMVQPDGSIKICKKTDKEQNYGGKGSLVATEAGPNDATQ